MTTTQDCTTQEKIDGLTSAIKDAEWRIGSYIVQGGNKSDQYVQDQMTKIYGWVAQVGELCGMHMIH